MTRASGPGPEAGALGPETGRAAPERNRVLKPARPAQEPGNEDGASLGQAAQAARPAGPAIFDGARLGEAP